MEYFTIGAAPELRRSIISNVDSTSEGIKCLDATTYSRVGIRGEKAEAFLVDQNLPVPHAPNHALISGGFLVLRLSHKEFWIIDTLNSNQAILANLELIALNTKGLYRLYCQHSHTMMFIEGSAVAKMFAKLCAVDMSESSFPTGTIAQTSVARTNAIVVRTESGSKEQFVLLSDIASAQYLWEAIEDAASEYH
ncbi:hypothetical protein OAP63_05405 [Vibrio sp.]|nr:hypothetical protein [Vibrio sp.]